MMLLTLYFVIAIVALTILIPVYYYGADASWYPNYLTFWSEITIPHLEQGSIMTLIPIIVTILFTFATMFFYH